MASLRLLPRSLQVWGIRNEKKEGAMFSIVGDLFRTLLMLTTIGLYFLFFGSVGFGFFIIYGDVIKFMKTGSLVFITFSKYTDGVFDGHINSDGQGLDSINAALIQIGETPACMVLIAGGIACLILLLVVSFITPRRATPVK